MQTVYTVHISLNNALAFSLPPILPYTSLNWILNKSFDFAKEQIENITSFFFMGVGANLSFLKSLYFSPFKNFQLHYIQHMYIISNMGERSANNRGKPNYIKCSNRRSHFTVRMNCVLVLHIEPVM